MRKISTPAGAMNAEFLNSDFRKAHVYTAYVDDFIKRGPMGNGDTDDSGLSTRMTNDASDLVDREKKSAMVKTAGSESRQNALYIAAFPELQKDGLESVQVFDMQDSPKASGMAEPDLVAMLSKPGSFKAKKVSRKKNSDFGLNTLKDTKRHLQIPTAATSSVTSNPSKPGSSHELQVHSTGNYLPTNPVFTKNKKVKKQKKLTLPLTAIDQLTEGVQ